MDQDLAWWSEVVFDGWRHRPGPRYQRLASALLDAVDRRVVREDTRVPAERTLAAALGVSRGTVVACFDDLVEAGILRRRQGSGTYVLGRPSWAATNSIASFLLRRMADNRDAIDLSISGPVDLRHLPPVDPVAAWSSLDGHGIEPAGLPALRSEIARHLTEQQMLPTSPEQVVVTAGAQEALWLLGQALAPGPLVTTCPTYPGLSSALSQRKMVVDGWETAAREPGSLVYLMPTGHNPTGAVMPTVRRQAMAAIAETGPAAVIDDLTLADLLLDAPQPPPPLATFSANVITVGSASKLLWGGLRIGWIRADEPVRSAVISQKAAANLATSALSQAMTAQLLAKTDHEWLAAHRQALARRRDHLMELLAERLPDWRIHRPAAGLSLWIELPTDNVEAYALTAARHGVRIAPGSQVCLDGRHHRFIRLCFAEQLDTLTLAVARLAEAWEAHQA